MEQLAPRLDECFHDVAYERYREHSGQVDAACLGEVFERFEDLASGDALDGLRAARDQDGLLASTREGYARQVLLVEDVVLAARAAALPLNEKAGADPDALEELLEERFVRMGEERARIGYATAADRVSAQLEEIELERWERAAAQVLESSESAYRDRLAAGLERAGTDPARASEAELEAAVAGTIGDPHLPAERLLPALGATLEGWRVHWDGLTGVRTDALVRAGRAPRAAAFLLSVPGEIVVSLDPARAGVRAAGDLFLAAGRALHAAYSSPELPVELRRGGDPALGAAFALLAAECIYDPHWLERSVPAERVAELCEQLRLVRLLALRRAAARLPIELALARVPAGERPHGCAEAYAKALAEALGISAPQAGYLERVGPELASLHELRALCLAAQVGESLRERFGRAFWREPRCGDLMKELWNTGTSYRAEALASELDVAPLDLEHALAAALR